MKKGRFLSIALVAVCAAFVLHAGVAFAGVLEAPPTVISTYDALADRNPAVSGKRVVWEAWDGNDYEIYLWQPGDSAPTNLSNSDGIDDYAPGISGDRVVWYGVDGSSDYDVYTWTPAGGVVNVSNNPSVADYNPVVSGDRIAWIGDDGDEEVFTWTTAGGVVQLTDNDAGDFGVKVSGNRVAWVGFDGADNEVFTWAGGAVTQVTDNTDIDDESVALDADRLAWAAYDFNANQYDIFTLKIGGAIDNISETPADGANDNAPQVSGDRVVWYGTSGGLNDIFLWKAGDAAPTNLSKTASADEYSPQISGDRVAWYGDSGANGDVFLWRVGDAAPLNVSDSAAVDDSNPQLSGGRVVWVGSDASHEEVYTAAADSSVPQVKAPADASLVATSAAGASLTFAATATDDVAVVGPITYYIGATQITSPHVFPVGVTTVRCEAKDAAGNMGTATFKVTVVFNSTLTLTAAPSTPSYGGSTTLHATLKGADGALSGQTVVFEQLSAGVWQKLAEKQTAAGGTASLKVSGLKSKASYRVRFAAAATRVAAEDSLDVFPKVKLARSSSWKGRSRNVKYSATGYITPKHAVSDKNKIKIRAYKKGSDGKYHYVKSFTASYVAFSKTKTKYRATVKFTSKGSWAIRAYHAKDATHAATYGSWDYFKVK